MSGDTLAAGAAVGEIACREHRWKSVGEKPDVQLIARKSRRATHGPRTTEMQGARRSAHLSTMILVGAALAGCSSATLSAGASLSKAGQAAATQMEQNVTLSESVVTSMKKAVAFNDGFNDAVGNASSQSFLQHMASIQKKLIQYGKLLDSLSDSYAALGELANYDATGSFNTAIGNLATDTASFGTAVGAPINIPTNFTGGVQAVGGFVIGWAQASAVRDGSRRIVTILEQVIAILERPSTREQLVSIQREATGQIDQAAVTLVFAGVFSYGPTLDEMGAPLGQKSTQASDAAVKANARVLAGLRNVALETVEERTAAVAASYDKNLAALKALITLHKDLENGQPLSLSSMNSIVGQLQTIAATLKPAKGK